MYLAGSFTYVFMSASAGVRSGLCTISDGLLSAVKYLDDLVWGPWMLLLLLGTGIYLTLRMGFLPLKNLKAALKLAVSGGGAGKGKEGISSFSSLMTELAITIGTGNILGVATAMVLGGPGALFWMIVTSFIGLATKLAESTLSVKYRSCNERGEPAGGPMYTCVRALGGKTGRFLGCAFALLAVFSSLGMGNMTQSNSIADALWHSFQIPRAKTGLWVAVLTILVVLGGIRTISGVTRFLVPAMGLLYLLGSLGVILTHIGNLPGAAAGIIAAAISPSAVSGGLFGTVTVNAFQSLRWGAARGIFSNEAGLGAAGITAAAAATDDPVGQGYISMTGVFLDTAVMCTVTGLSLASSGVLGLAGTADGSISGTGLILAAFRSTFGKSTDLFVSTCITLFAFATIIGWAYQGERAFEFLMGGRTRNNIWYRFGYGLTAFFGCIFPLEAVWGFSDVCNGLMAVPNLICVLALSEKVCREIREYGLLSKK